MISFSLNVTQEYCPKVSLIKHTAKPATMHCRAIAIKPAKQSIYNKSK